MPQPRTIVLIAHEKSAAVVAAAAAHGIDVHVVSMDGSPAPGLESLPYQEAPCPDLNTIELRAKHADLHDRRTHRFKGDGAHITSARHRR